MLVCPTAHVSGAVSGHGDPTEVSDTGHRAVEVPMHLLRSLSPADTSCCFTLQPSPLEGNKMHPAGNYSHMKQCAKDQAVRELSGGVADFPVAVRDNRSKREFSQ